MTDEHEGATTGSAVGRPHPPRYQSLVKRNPAAITELLPKQKLMVQYMVHGCDKPWVSKLNRVEQRVVAGVRQTTSRPLEMDEPLTLEEAAQMVRIRPRMARALTLTPGWKSYMAEQVALLRNAAKPLAMNVVVETLTADADTAAERKVRLEAADRILGDDIGSPRSNGPQVNINIGAVEPGYVIRLPARAPAEQPRTIEHQPSSEPAE